MAQFSLYQECNYVAQFLPYQESSRNAHWLPQHVILVTLLGVEIWQGNCSMYHIILTVEWLQNRTMEPGNEAVWNQDPDLEGFSWATVHDFYLLLLCACLLIMGELQNDKSLNESLSLGHTAVNVICVLGFHICSTSTSVKPQAPFLSFPD